MTPKTVQILLVEDNPNDLRLALRTFEKLKLRDQLHVVRDGAEALVYLFEQGADAEWQNHSKPKIILLDLKLPKVSGLEVLERLKQDPRTRTIPVVVLTSSNQERDMVASYNLGVNSYIVKPIDFQQFDAAIHTIGAYWLNYNQLPSS
jgi:two-component system response regulator